MILIISEALEHSTTEVINWLRFLKQKYLRINAGDLVQIKEIRFNGIIPGVEFTVNGGDVMNTDDLTGYWYRRGALTVPLAYDYRKYIKERPLQNTVIENIGNEIKTLKELLYFIFENRENKLGGFYTKENNKLMHLSMAKESGIVIPETLVCTAKKTLIDFYKKNPGGIIIKAIGNSFTHISRKPNELDTVFVSYTNVVTAADVKDFPENFPPTLLQNKIDKKFELRVFYLKGKFFSMAIFSQNDEKTKVDFRRYNKEKQNYRVPFALPAALKRKLKRFMEKAQLDTGSIDLIYNTAGEFVFLEVNPVGQFGMVSYPCNYNLEKEIAIVLSNAV
ncbi:MAG: hypothetical protein JWP12_518 [Bacteroidetes bacterium]|nr:hypothetical protein [Bacteroidota bacterium]